MNSHRPKIVITNPTANFLKAYVFGVLLQATALLENSVFKTTVAVKSVAKDFPTTVGTT